MKKTGSRFAYPAVSRLTMAWNILLTVVSLIRRCASDQVRKTSKDKFSYTNTVDGSELGKVSD